MVVNADQVQALQRTVLETIGENPGEWPGGYPDEIEAALIDAVFSVRARYGNREKKTGVFGAAWRWREHRGWAANDLNVLAQADPEQLADITNHARLSGRLKAEVVVDAAEALRDAGITTADDFRDNQHAAQRAYLSVKGCGRVTWAYLRMLVGLPDVKADTRLRAFVVSAVSSALNEHQVSDLVKAVADAMGVDQRRLDHAIWSYQRAL